MHYENEQPKDLKILRQTKMNLPTKSFQKHVEIDIPVFGLAKVSVLAEIMV